MQQTASLLLIVPFNACFRVKGRQAPHTKLLQSSIEFWSQRRATKWHFKSGLRLHRVVCWHFTHELQYSCTSPHSLLIEMDTLVAPNAEQVVGSSSEISLLLRTDCRACNLAKELARASCVEVTWRLLFLEDLVMDKTTTLVNTAQQDRPAWRTQQPSAVNWGSGPTQARDCFARCSSSSEDGD